MQLIETGCFEVSAFMIPDHERRTKQKDEVMKIGELIEKVKDADPYLFGNSAQEKLGMKLLRTAFAVIRNEIDETESGMVGIAGLGHFRVKRVERKNKEGEAETRRAITFVTQRRRDKSGIIPSE